MKHTLMALTMVAALFAAGCRLGSRPGNEMLSAEYLRCEYRTDPLGIDQLHPRLSWTLAFDKRGSRQTAYHVCIASNPEKLQKDIGDLWDSGKVESDETSAIVYAGKPLQSGMDCWWKVRVWDEQSAVSRWSAPAKWSTGLLNEADWKAEWIGYDVPDEIVPRPAIIQDAQWLWCTANAHLGAAPVTCSFKKTFEVPSEWVINKAVCYFTADDYAVLYLNGSKIRAFRNSKVMYEVNLADYLRSGTNVLVFQAANEGDSDSSAGFIAAIYVESDSGDKLAFATDETWLVSTGEHTGEPPQNVDSADWSKAAVLGPLGMAPWEQTKALQVVRSPARYFRTEFEAADKKIRRAYVHTTALGIYQLSVNGTQFTRDYLSPGWTDYRRRVYYRTYDVTEMLRRGDNAIGAIVADGWYAGYVGGGLTRNHYGKQLRLLLQLTIDYEDGTSQTIATGPDWKASLGPILQADLLQGEYYDARKEMPRWNTPRFDDSHWNPVVAGTAEVSPKVQAAVSEPVIAFETIKPVSVAEPVKGKYVFDMGQNFAGVVQVRVKGRSGQMIQLRHAERLNADGTIYTTNLRTAGATDTYICKGIGEEIWQPHFTFHGFQYVEVSGLAAAPSLDSIMGLALSSDTPVAGTFACSNPMVNKLQSNALWTQRMNFIDIPTDCPQRDERLGWTGDAQVYIQTACYHTDVQTFFTKWLTDLDDAQREDGQYPRYAPLRTKTSDGGPAWSDAGVICPWTIYKMYGDTRILEQHYDNMKRFIEFNRKRCTPELLPPEKFQCFGDWLSIGEETPHDVIYMAYFGLSTNLLSQTAEILGYTQDAAEYRHLFEQIKTAFQKAYVQPDGKIKGDTQAGYVLAIAYDLLDGPQQEQAGRHLVRRIGECGGHLSTGFVGTKDLMLALAKIDRNDVAYSLLYKDTFPSWGFSIKYGATSIWERWNGWTPEDGFGDPGMNSFAHYSFGAVCQWIFENIGGIKPAEAGFKSVIINPQPDGKLVWAKTSYRSIRGAIVSNWKVQDGFFVLDVTVPANTSATVMMPCGEPEKIMESGVKAAQAEGVHFIEKRDGSSLYKISSGRYRFSSPWRHPHVSEPSMIHR